MDYIRHLRAQFAPRWHGFSNFEAYLRYMSSLGNWGDEVALQTVANIMLRPIHIVSDVDDYQSPLILEPQAPISADAWGEPIVLANWLDRHYEATFPLASTE